MATTMHVQIRALDGMHSLRVGSVLRVPHGIPHEIPHGTFPLRAARSRHPAPPGGFLGQRSLTMTTTKTRTPKPSLCLLMTEKREHGYLHIYGRVVTQRYAEAQYHVEGPDDRYSDGPLYSG